VTVVLALDWRNNALNSQGTEIFFEAKLGNLGHQLTLIMSGTSDSFLKHNPFPVIAAKGLEN
jgi:hypothetical protein